MAKSENQKLKLYYLKKILIEKTDKEHSITLPQIIDELAKYEISAERKSLYRDIAELEHLGVVVKGEKKGRDFYYHVEKSEFEIAELKLLVDAIQSSKFITVRKSRDLIKKLEGFISEHEAYKLQRQVYVQGRIKTMNESIYQMVDDIHEAIEKNKQIKFKYLEWNTKKELVERHDGQWYQISPWALTWDDENYYLVGFDDKAGKIKHYRVDKMTKLSVTDVMRQGKGNFEKFDLAAYAKKTFGMYGGEDQKVTVRATNSKVGIFLDRFGTDISVYKSGPEHVEIKFSAAVSGQFLGWIFGLGEDVEIIGPAAVVAEAKSYAKRLSKQYK